MKKLFLLLSLPVLLLAACDKVKTPIIPQNGAVGKTFTTKSNKTVNSFYKVLIEDYTGHTCGNCPKAGAAADALVLAYGNKVVVMAVHAGPYAYPAAGFPQNFQTHAGTTWDSKSYFGVSGIGNPNGLINRKPYGGSIVESYTQWDATVVNALAVESMTVKLLVTTNYDPTARALNTDIVAEYQSDYANDVNVLAVIIEDGIIGAQTNYSKYPDRDTLNVFNHVLRGSLNGDFGNLLKSGPSAAGDSAFVSNKNFKLDASFNDNNISVVVFAFDAKTLEVIQAEKVKIR